MSTARRTRLGNAHAHAVHQGGGPLIPLLLAVVACTLLAAPAARAQKFWVGGTGNWDTAGNWSPSGEPVSGDQVYVFNGGTVQVTTTGNAGGGPFPNNVELGAFAGTSGHLEVLAGGGLTTGNVLAIGQNGMGSLLVSGGGDLASNYAAMGNFGSATGTATVTGTGSTWVANYLDVGSSGTGSLDVLDGGSVTVSINADGSFQIANDAAAMGEVLVSGTGSTLSAFNTRMATGALSNATLVVEGANATNSFITGLFEIGVAGEAEFTLQSGAKAQSGSTTLGVNSAAHGTALVDGSGSVWTATVGTITVGSSGEGDLTVQNSGKISGIALSIGAIAGSDGFTTVTGADSEVTLSGIFTVGSSGLGQLDILDGGLVSTTVATYVGRNATGQGILNIRGVNATTMEASTLNVGGNFNIGAQDFAGSPGGWGVVTVDQGGQLNIGNNLIMGSIAGQTSELNLDGEGTAMTYGTTSGTGTSAIIGSNATSNAVVNVTGGATVTGPASETVGNSTTLPGMSVGAINGASGTINIDGAGSSWTSGHWAWIGEKGDGAVNVTDGGHFTVSIMELGRNGTGDGAVTVSGAGSIVTVGTTNPDAETSVGYGGHGSITITDGGLFTTDEMFVARRLVLFQGMDIIEDSTGAGEITVAGAGSRLEVSKELVLGDAGHGEMLIELGGVVSVSNLAGTEGSFAAGGLSAVGTGTANITVRDTDSLLEAAEDLSIGYNTTATINVSEGGQVRAMNSYLGRFTGSEGIATVSGEGSKWTSTEDFTLANGSQSTAELTVDDGADVEVGDEFIVTLGGHALTHADAYFRDSGTSLTAGRLFIAGRFGASEGSGQLTVANGASAIISGAARIFVNGTLNIGEGGLAGTFSAASMENDGLLHFEHTDDISYNVNTTGTGDVLKEGSGRVTVAGSNGYTGETTISQGILRAASNTALGSIGGGTTVEDGAALELAGGVNIGAEALALSGDGVGGSGGALRSVSGANTFGGVITLTIGSAIAVVADSLGINGDVDLQANRLILDTNGNLTLQGDVIGSGDIEKTGSGKVTVTSMTQYTGAFQIAAGELELNGGFDSTSEIIVEGGGRLSGTGTAGTIYLSEAGIVAPGNSPGTLEGTDLFWEEGGIMEFELGDSSSAANSDLLELSGDLIADRSDGPFLFDFYDGTGLPTLGATYTLITFSSHSGFLVDWFEFTYGGAHPDFDGYFVLNDESLQFVTIPEPGPTLLLALVGVLAFLARRRRKVSGG